MKKNFGNVELRSLMRQNLLRLRNAVTKAVSYRKVQPVPRHKKIEELKHDIMNGPYHIFGDHSNCLQRGYFCNGIKEGEVNHVPEMKANGMFHDILSTASRVSYHADSLIEDVDTNSVESYNSQIAKAVGGKRVNLCLKQSYQVSNVCIELCRRFRQCKIRFFATEKHKHFKKAFIVKNYDTSTTVAVIRVVVKVL